MLYIALALLFFALLFFWQSSRQRKETGLPAGRVIYTDTRGWGTLDKPLFYGPLQLTGKPDYLIEKNGTIIPVEVKSGKTPDVPYDSHIYQLASYCLLVEKTYNKRPPYGIIHYEKRDFAVDYTPELEQSLLALLVEMQEDEEAEEVDRSHEQASRCRRCGYNSICDQSMV